MTDLTRLLASLKRRSAHVKEFGDDITFVKLEDLDVLVEALEKAQQEHRLHAARLISEKALLKERIAELEEAEQKLCAANVTLDARAELAERRLAEREQANAAQDDHINQQQDRIEQLEKRNAELGKYAKELESFRTAYMEWSDKTDWVQGDKRFDVLIPWGKHRADVLKAYIERLESRTVTVKLPQAVSAGGQGYQEKVERILTAAGIKWEAE